MAEIGATLREARMRAGIDIAEIEARTKIRAKYLRALENEEWNLLPGPTFVKSFLRTYAEALGLDAKLLVEEYKFRHEPYETGVGGAAPRGRARAGGRPGRTAGNGGPFGPQRRSGLLPLLVLILVVAAVIYAVIALSQDERDATTAGTTATTTTDAAAAQETRERQRRREQRAAARRAERRRLARLVKLRITAGSTSSATVCVVDASGRKVVDGRELQPGRRTTLLRSRRFDLTIGGTGVTVTDGGRVRRLTPGPDGVIAYRLTKGAATRLPASRRPACG